MAAADLVADLRDVGAQVMIFGLNDGFFHHFLAYLRNKGSKRKSAVAAIKEAPIPNLM